MKQYMIAFILFSNGIGFSQNKIFMKAENNVAPFPLEEELLWWAPQMSEHALFLYLGLNGDKVPRLKYKGKKLHHKLHKIANTFKHYNRLEPHSHIVKEYMYTLKQLRVYKQEALKATKKGWVGDLYPSLIKHMIKELDYHVDDLRGTSRTLAQELKFWNDHTEDVALVTAHLLDPSEKQLIHEATSLADSIEKLKAQKEEQESFKQLSLNASKELQAYGDKIGLKIKSHNVESVINPVLLNHEARENAYAMKKIFGIAPKL